MMHCGDRQAGLEPGRMPCSCGKEGEEKGNYYCV